MNMNDPTHDIANLRQQELKNLRLLASESQIQDGLNRIAGTFGKVNSVVRVDLQKKCDSSEYVFFVDFEDTLDAMTAARHLNGFLYGFSALMLKVQKN
ncbi:MAG: RNA-binding protein [Sterolibacterium sp.]|nr:RNA-binding protein [Sterolibacterium sp.]